jgi:catechol 2,3-dioxygenase-like lactoylglutathione lyase family enzyme
MNTQRDTGAAVHLDHVGYIVRDLDACAALVRQLGFVLTARADHTRTDAQGLSVPAGSSQHSIMLHSGYVELMQITDPHAGHQLASAPSQRHGLHVLAFGTGDAVACHARRIADGVAAGEVLYWSRPVHEPDLQGMAQFAYFGSAWTPRDPSYLCWVEHRTPRLLRNPRLLAHDNGARALIGIRYAGPAAALAPWTAQLRAAGARLVHDGAQHKRLALPDAVIDVDADARCASVLPQSLSWGGADLHWLRAQCARMGLRCEVHDDGTLEVDLQSVLGMNWRFLPAKTAA